MIEYSMTATVPLGKPFSSWEDPGFIPCIMNKEKYARIDKFFGRHKNTFTLQNSSQCITINSDGVLYMFVSLIPGVGIVKGISTVVNAQLYSVKFSHGSLGRIFFYEDKGLKWINRDQTLFPDVGFEMVEISEDD